MPLELTSLSTPAIHTSVASAHSFAALSNPDSAPNTAMRIILCTPHSLSVWIAAALVPPVAIIGSRRIASVGAEELVVEGEAGERLAAALVGMGMW